MHRRTATTAVLLSIALTSSAYSAPCPVTGGSIEVEVVPPANAGPSEITLSGTRIVSSCEGDDTLSTTYTLRVNCEGDGPCMFDASRLAPGLWLHRIFVTAGASLGQIQARRGLVLDASAGTHSLRWPLFRTVFTVLSADDDAECQACLRRALELSATAEKPMLIAFNPSVDGDLTVSDQLPALSASRVTIDAIDFDGLPHRRTIDANGRSDAGLRITGSDNHVIGLRIANVGGGSDMLLIDGPGASRNRIESVQIVGRAIRFCERAGSAGCIIDNLCITPTPQSPRGACGDDGIAIRDDAGVDGANVLIDVDVSGAFDKGVKVSEGGVAQLHQSWIHQNADGGVQTTFGGTLTAIENRSEGNRGTLGANGLAANGPRLGTTDPAFLTTRGNLLRDNALRGLSIRSLSLATIRDDFICGNGTIGTDVGFGLALLDAAGFSASADVHGTALVNNLDGGVLTDGNSTADLGDTRSPGHNAIGFNGSNSNLDGPAQFRNLTTSPMSAVGNQWEQCGSTFECSEIAVLIGAIFAPESGVEVVPALASPQRRAPVIHEIRPTFAREGDLVWIYGENFDAIGAAAADPECDGAGRPCRASDPNCVFVGNQTAEIIAATPTLLVVRAPFTCVEPVKLGARTRRSRGFARTTFCTVGQE